MSLLPSKYFPPSISTSYQKYSLKTMARYDCNVKHKQRNCQQNIKLIYLRHVFSNLLNLGAHSSTRIWLYLRGLFRKKCTIYACTLIGHDQVGCITAKNTRRNIARGADCANCISTVSLGHVIWIRFRPPKCPYVRLILLICS
jgi:hypothetical protein